MTTMIHNYYITNHVFQEDNGLPVHIKGGSTDMILYRITMTLTIIGRIRHYYSNLNPVCSSLSVLLLNLICLVLFRHWNFLLLASGGLDAQTQNRIRRRSGRTVHVSYELSQNDFPVVQTILIKENLDE